MKIKSIIKWVVLASLLFTINVKAQDWKPVQPVDESSKISMFQSYSVLPDLKIKIPTVVQFSVNASEISGFAQVYDVTDKKFIPNSSNVITKKGPIISSILGKNGANYLSLEDNNNSTFINFYLEAQPVFITYNYSEPLTSNSITIVPSENSPLPDSITIRATINGSSVIVVSNLKPNGRTISFPSTNAKSWIIEFNHSQPLRIAEMKFNNIINVVDKTQIRFLAQPNHLYSVYANSETGGVVANWSSNYDLLGSSTYIDIGTFSLITNTSFVPLDTDADGVSNKTDNCKDVSNKDQSDEDSNGIGDLCDDYDRDFIQNYKDNCPSTPNSDQLDTDGDLVGDKCDSDESRLTEKYPAIVWGGIIFAFMIFIVLLLIAAKKIKDQNSNGGGNITTTNVQ